ncbi:MAG: hypothetical protein ACE5ID_10755 [Acidobacteriota bacterium]
MRRNDILGGPPLRILLSGMILFLLAHGELMAQSRRVTQSPARVGGRMGAVLESDPGGGGGRSGVLNFTLGPALFTPGEHGEVSIHTQEAVPLSSGRLTLGIDPPVFVNNPVVEFAGSGDGLSYQMTPAGPGVYIVDFSSASVPLNVELGLFMRLQGIVSQQFQAGEPVQITLSAAARSVSGRLLPVAAQGGSTTLLPAKPALSVRIKGNRNLLPGDKVLVEVRTITNPKPISEGQVCLFFDPTFFSSVGAATVLSAVPDVSFTMDVQTSGQVRVQFSSPSASINSQPGAMVTLELTVAAHVPPGTLSTIDVDLMQTRLTDHTGLPLALDSQSGLFQVKP